MIYPGPGRDRVFGDRGSDTVILEGSVDDDSFGAITRHAVQRFPIADSEGEDGPDVPIIGLDPGVTTSSDVGPFAIA